MALSRTQEEMAMALDYIESDLKQAVYVYEGECLTGRPDDPITKNIDESCPGLSKVISFPTGVTPILAFWKLDEVPYSTKSEDQLPADCTATPDSAACNALKISRNTYTLVVYSLRTDTPSGETWEGPARLTRYQLRQYSNLSAMTETSGWRDPAGVNFTKWPCDDQNAGCTTAQLAYSEGGTNKTADVLVDVVDNQDNPAAVACPDSNPAAVACPDSNPYSTAKATGFSSFYAFVRRPNQGSSQDVIVYLRGNAIKRAGMIGRNPSYLPQLQAQIKTRTVFNYIPPDLIKNP